jgi:hypothetical protein
MAVAISLATQTQAGRCLLDDEMITGRVVVASARADDVDLHAVAASVGSMIIPRKGKLAPSTLAPPRKLILLMKLFALGKFSAHVFPFG